MYIILLVIVICIIFWIINYKLICVSKYSIKSNKIPDTFENYKILHLSDWHCTKYGKNNKRLIKIIKKQKYDIILISGDFAVRQTQEYLPAIDFLNQLTDKPIYYVLGNHELSLSKEKLTDYKNKLSKIGVRVLENEKIELVKNGKSIELYGLRYNSDDKDSMHLSDEKIIDKYIAKYLNELGNLDKTKYNVLLTHDPLYFEVYARLGYDLVYAGHLHGGAIRFFGFCLAKLKGGIIITRLGAGIKSKYNTKMIVSRGIGNSTIPIRVFDPPEISITTFHHLKY